MRMIDADEMIAGCEQMIQDSWNSGTAPVGTYVTNIIIFVILIIILVALLAWLDRQ